MSPILIISILAVMLLTIAVPLGVMLYLHRHGGKWTDFLTGAGTFILFALVLEQIPHYLVMNSPMKAVLQENIWLYGLYGGLAAGLFEETGRLLAFRTVLRSRRPAVTSLSYGIGHGGIEAFLLAGLTMLSNLILGLTYANGGTIPAEIVPAVETLLTTSPVLFLWSGIERLSAMMLHVSLSVLVFAAVRTGKWKLFLAAFLIHWAADFIAVVSAAYLPTAAVEGLVLLIAIQAAVWAAFVYKKLPEFAENT